MSGSRSSSKLFSHTEKKKSPEDKKYADFNAAKKNLYDLEYKQIITHRDEAREAVIILSVILSKNLLQMDKVDNNIEMAKVYHLCLENIMVISGFCSSSADYVNLTHTDSKDSVRTFYINIEHRLKLLRDSKLLNIDSMISFIDDFPFTEFEKIINTSYANKLQNIPNEYREQNSKCLPCCVIL